MKIRRSILTASAVALVLAGCAGTATDGTDATDATAATAAQDEAATGDSGTQSEAADEDTTATDDAAEDADATAEDAEDHGDDEDMDAHADDGHEEVAADGDVDRVVEIDMEDIAFSVDELEFSVGERVRFVFENVGEAPHEALIGDMHLQEEHEAEMAEDGGHDDGGHHGEMSMISLESGESGSMVHEFTEAGELWMGCHVPGHWGAGMKTPITVTS